ncbi:MULTISPECIES: hypothetical protein [unclassified Oceanispirochaeta]|uniref:hypothetical protein n=1 Tax=unclassified Oceanispirochaeta TaxID=2635722 RepID=UPI000E095640|nr:MULTISPECIES: hypothetical protein [unclassified Oceanispirochaeta]MBF9017239.1 hypothetical protein [Oceanispirochaeta sp. M2]NPD73688.1 hypothetical protein [Oceanispirochaeta sp. M1]RDG30616.1 hypothetical protein DV872_16470 [Oceanispirochaeta sp. M1]
MNKFSFLSIFLILLSFQTTLYCSADDFSAADFSANEELLLKYRINGDYLKESNLRTVLEELLFSETDPLSRTALKRLLYQELIELPDDIFFDKHISALAADGDDLWMGSRSGDIARYSLSEKSWKSFIRGQDSLAIKTMQTILPDHERIWFLSYGSVGVYSKRHSRLIYLDIPDEKDYRGLQSGIVVGTGLITGTQSRGLRRIRLDSQSVLPLASDLRNVTFLQALDDQRILAGSEEDGLFILDRSFNASAAGQNSRQLSAARAVLGDSRSRMIAGSYGGGLYKLVRQGDKYDIVLLNSRTRWITGGVELPEHFCFSTLGQGLLVMEKESLEISYLGISEGLGGLDMSSIAYVEPYIICAVQEQGLVKIHEDLFRTP